MYTSCVLDVAFFGSLILSIALLPIRKLRIKIRVWWMDVVKKMKKMIFMSFHTCFIFEKRKIKWVQREKRQVSNIFPRGEEDQTMTEAFYFSGSFVGYCRLIEMENSAEVTVSERRRNTNINWVGTWNWCLWMRREIRGFNIKVTLEDWKSVNGLTRNELTSHHVSRNSHCPMIQQEQQLQLFLTKSRAEQLPTLESAKEADQ